MIEYEIVEDLLEADIEGATAILISIMNGTNLNMKGLREKLEEELDSFSPVIVVGGQQIIGWFPQKTHKHRGVPIYVYLRRTHSVLGSEDVETYRVAGEYSNPNDRLQRLNPDNEEHTTRKNNGLFHLDDVGTESREEAFEPKVKSYVRTPHDLKR